MLNRKRWPAESDREYSTTSAHGALNEDRSIFETFRDFLCTLPMSIKKGFVQPTTLMPTMELQGLYSLISDPANSGQLQHVRAVLPTNNRGELVFSPIGPFHSHLGLVFHP
jgi:hypothetical protein